MSVDLTRRCVCKHVERDHARYSTFYGQRTRCLVEGCACSGYHRFELLAPYADGAAADGAGRIARLVKLVERGRFE